jgi:hypothetical protein
VWQLHATEVAALAQALARLIIYDHASANLTKQYSLVEIFLLVGFFAGSAVLILTNGFAKKSQKTPRQEIELATRRKNEYLSRQRKQ